MASNLNIKRGPSKCDSNKPIKCCVHGDKCSIGLKTMSTETLTRSEKSSESISFEEQEPIVFRLQRAESFTKFKFTRFLGHEYICERNEIEKDSRKMKESKSIEDNSAFPMKRYYIGIVTPQTAELFVSRNTAFRLYHSLKEINDEKVPLCIVYKNSRGDFYHYLIRERFDKNLHTDLLYVDCGDEEPPEFIGIEALIKYYTVYASLHSFSLANGLSVDVFPWWHLISNV
ncbi:protein B0207.11, putative [Brugia malayi]|uniref:Bm7691 n=3 Tax=Brugia malayi TaxID=6279 RepID=A0A4E9G276_BRUMA|nr:protein B0207.11, putative [Brugia malayi]VIO99476.1 protein B0207.11, putative [Brugia malayi]